MIDRVALKRLLEVIGNDPQDLADLLSDYKEDAPDLVRRIDEAAVQGNADALRIAAHTLKSNARDFGALHLSALCAELERICSAGGSSIPRDAIDEIAQAEEQARLELSQICLNELLSAPNAR